MVGLIQDEAPDQPPVPAVLPDSDCKPIHQKVNLDLDIWNQTLKGSTEIEIAPASLELKTIKLNCRQMRITRVTVSSKAVANMAYSDPYKLAVLPWETNVHQYHMLEDRIQDYVKITPESELIITLPKSIKIYEINPNGSSGPVSSAQSARLSADDHPYSPISVYIEFAVDRFQDGLQFIGCDEADLRFPHVYTSKLSQRSMCCIFPCFDSLEKRCSWELSFRTARTIGDAISVSGDETIQKGVNGSQRTRTKVELNEQDRAKDLKVICSGDITDEIYDANDPTKKTTSFAVGSNVSAQHIGFAIGAFQTVDLAAFRESNEDDRLGRSAIPIFGFCLPGRAEEVENTCFPLAKAMDWIVSEYSVYMFSNFKICFVDGMVQDRIDTATLSIVSNRLLFPPDIIDTMDYVTRELIYGLACQWSGIDIVPKEPTDIWATVGIAYFMTDSIMRKLSGNNEYRFNHTKAAEKVVEMDIGRPSISESGRYLYTDPSHLELINAKAPLVLYILDRRLTKTSGSTGMPRIISKIFLNRKVRSLPDESLTTAEFIKICERIGHTKLDVFFNQWVLCAGCPRFRVTQRFNKKRLVVELQIMQSVGDPTNDGELQSDTFMRNLKEHVNEIYEGDTTPVFTGPMTIRIHEADGTPYEHIVEIRETITRFEIPYNTKYKRLKRTRKQREKVAAGLTGDQHAEGNEESLLYCLGDVLQSPEEETQWRLANWSKEEEEKMSSESYEWIRMDADFEWICKLSINMPGYMYVSQLQQDRDVNAQYETIQYLAGRNPHPLISTFLVRTTVDKRYFHGVRSAAAAILASQSTKTTDYVGLYHLLMAYNFLYATDSEVATSNDFSDRAAYYVRCSIIRSIGKIRHEGRSPIASRKFLFDQLRGNDNSENEISDCNYVALLMRSLAEACASAPMPDDDEMMVDMEDGDDWRFQRACAEEIDRHRRADEWIPSYQNVISEAAMDCAAMLAMAKIVPRSPLELIPYTRDGTNERLRISAFRNLLSLGFFKEDYILEWFMFVLGHDGSPYVRFNLLRLFGEWIGALAIGQDYHELQRRQAPRQDGTGLVIEQETSTESRKADLERKQSISGARAALQAILTEDETLKRLLWQAINSTAMTLSEIADLLTVCGQLYEPHTAMTIKLQYPRFYKAINRGFIPAGNGLKKRQIVSFVPTRARTTKLPQAPQLKIKPPLPPTPARRDSSGKPTVLKLKLNPSHSKSMLPPASSGGGAASPPGPGTPSEDGKPKLKLKLKLGGQGSPPANGMGHGR